MATITENIARIQQAKADIKEAIIAKGGTLAEDAKLSEFKEAIEGLPSGADLGRYGVDFADKIEEGHPAFSSPLRENVDYYNSVVDSIDKGINTEDDYLTGDKMVEFKTKIAWFPPSFTEQTTYSYYTNLQYLEIKANVTLERCIVYWMKILKGVHNGYYRITKTSNIHVADLPPQEQAYLYNFSLPNRVRELKMNGSKVIPAVNDSFTYGWLTSVDEFELHGVTSFIKPTSQNLHTFNLSKLKYNVNLSSTSVLREASVKHILDNCQAKEDGTPYTLTLHEDVKTRFMAKCTEGDENYDAEYAATLAAANAKGLTIA